MRGLWPLCGVTGVVGLVSLAAPRALAQEAPAPARRIATAEPPKRLLEGSYVIAFANGSGVAGLDWLRVALAAELVEKLDVVPSLRVMNPSSLVPDG